MISSVVRVGAVTASVLGVTAPDLLVLVAVLAFAVGYAAALWLIISENAR